jgi:nucleoside-diphosphate-sugar epimerase
VVTLVTGATGFIGRYLVDRLLDDGGVIRALTRDPQRVPPHWHGRVQIAVGDVRDERALVAATENVDVVYHLAGEIRETKLFDDVNCVGTRRLLETCARNGPVRFLHCSSVGVIGARGKGQYDEQSPCWPANPYEISKLKAELAALEYGRGGQLRVTIVRPTTVFGPRGGIAEDSFLSWMRTIKQGRFRFIGSGRALANYVYVEDVARSCIFLASEEFAVGEILHIADPCTVEELVAHAAALLGVRMPGSIPRSLALGVALGLQTAGRVFSLPVPLTLNRVKALTRGSTFAGKRLSEKYRLPFGWRKGLRRTIHAYQTLGLL